MKVDKFYAIRNCSHIDSSFIVDDFAGNWWKSKNLSRQNQRETQLSMALLAFLMPLPLSA